MILGQVANDFSLIETGENGICSINVYIKIIEETLATPGWRVIFKAHPWENRKHNLRTSLTKALLDQSFSGNANYRSVEDHSLQDLFEEVTLVACISSQAGIEAAAFGFKPIQFGDAFWGNRGFSIDTSLSTVSNFHALLASPELGRLNWEEFRSFENWWVTLVDQWVIDERPSPKSDSLLRSIFFELPTRVTRVAATGSKGEILDSSVRAPKQTPSSGQVSRKFKKLLHDPKAFFKDSGHPMLRAISHLIP